MVASPKPFPYPCFVINLDRQPERLAAFRQWNDGCGLEIERFAAVDGRTLDEAARRALILFEPPSAGTYGLAASHKLLWERTVEAGRPHVILEDDAVLRSDIADELPRVIGRIGGFWDIILLGFNTNAPLHLRSGERYRGRPIHFEPYPNETQLRDHRQSRGDVEPYRLAHAFGVCGYIVSPMGARKLLVACFPVKGRTLFMPDGRLIKTPTVDSETNAIYATIDAYVCLPPLVMTPNDPATSSTTVKPQ
jgi:glycosyl transferase family 25